MIISYAWVRNDLKLKQIEVLNDTENYAYVRKDDKIQRKFLHKTRNSNQ